MPTLRELVAANVMRLCAETQIPADTITDCLTEAAGKLGLDWTVAWVRGLSNGTKALSGEHLLMLPFVLSEALVQKVSLADLLVSDEPITLQELKIEPTELRDVVIGMPYHRPFGTVEHTPSTSAAELAVEKARLVREANLGDVHVQALENAEAGAGEAEARLAHRLGVAEIVVIAAAARLWGHSLSEERDEQVSLGGDATAVTRRLSAEVRAHIRQAQTGTPSVAL